MRNSDRQQFSYETFVAAHDSDPRIQNLVKNFDQRKIDLKQSEVDDLGSSDAGSDTVGNMAAKATDLGSGL